MVEGTAAGILREWTSYARWLLRRRRASERGFFIFGAGRSGSTLLVDLLNSLPEVECDGEILHDRVLFPRLYVACRAALCSKPVYGFKLVTYQLTEVQRVESSELLRRLVAEGYTIVYLRRRNLLRHAISNLYARHRKRFHHRQHEGPLETMPMRVDLEALHDWLRQIRGMQTAERELLRPFPVIPVVYETDLENSARHQPTIDRLAARLGVQSAPTKTELVRISSSDLSEMIENYDEMISFVSGTEFREFVNA